MNPMLLELNKLEYEEHRTRVTREVQESKAFEAMIIRSVQRLYTQVRMLPATLRRQMQATNEGSRPQWMHW